MSVIGFIQNNFIVDLISYLEIRGITSAVLLILLERNLVKIYHIFCKPLRILSAISLKGILSAISLKGTLCTIFLQVFSLKGILLSNYY